MIIPKGYELRTPLNSYDWFIVAPERYHNVDPEFERNHDIVDNFDEWLRLNGETDNNIEMFISRINANLIKEIAIDNGLLRTEIFEECYDLYNHLIEKYGKSYIKKINKKWYGEPILFRVAKEYQKVLQNSNKTYN